MLRITLKHLIVIVVLIKKMGHSIYIHPRLWQLSLSGLVTGRQGQHKAQLL